MYGFAVVVAVVWMGGGSMLSSCPFVFCCRVLNIARLSTQITSFLNKDVGLLY